MQSLIDPIHHLGHCRRRHGEREIIHESHRPLLNPLSAGDHGLSVASGRETPDPLIWGDRPKKSPSIPLAYFGGDLLERRSGQCPSRRHNRPISAQSVGMVQRSGTTAHNHFAQPRQGLQEIRVLLTRCPRGPPPEGGFGALTGKTAQTKRRNEGPSIDLPCFVKRKASMNDWPHLK